jgi:hypothetical protein
MSRGHRLDERQAHPGRFRSHISSRFNHEQSGDGHGTSVSLKYRTRSAERHSGARAFVVNTQHDGIESEITGQAVAHLATPQ